MSVTFTVKTLAKFGEFYWSQYGNDYKAYFRNLALGNWKIALAEFLENYAFERQGRPQQFPIKAGEALKEYKGNIPADDFENDVWKKFCEKIGVTTDGKGANAKNNPLYPSSDNKKSITSLICSLGQKDYNIIRWAAEGIQNGGISEIFDQLQIVHGLGPKIISTFLRDIAVAFDINTSKLEPAKYLQPIDIWTRRGAEVLADKMQMPKPNNDEECAKVIVHVSYMTGVNPLLVNEGMWFFGAEFAQKEEKFRESLSNLDILNRLLDDQRKAYKAKVDFLERLLCDSRQSSTSL